MFSHQVIGEIQWFLATRAPCFGKRHIKRIFIHWSLKKIVDMLYVTSFFFTLQTQAWKGHYRLSA